MPLPFMPAVPNDQLEAEIRQLSEQIVQSQRRSKGLFDLGVKTGERAVAVAQQSVEMATTALLEGLQDGDPVDDAPWDEDRWFGWQPDRNTRWERLRVGGGRDVTDGRVGLSAHIPFIGGRGTVVVHSGTDFGSDEAAISLLQSLLARTALGLPHEASYTLLDPSGAGRAFPMRRLLPNVRANSDDVRRDLDEVNAEIRRIIETYLDASTTSFEMIPEDLRLNERFHFVFAANFPQGYDLRAVEALQSVAQTGPDAGVYLFVHHNHDVPVHGEAERYRFERAVDVTTGAQTLPGPAGSSFVVEPDRCPEPALQESVFAKLAAAAPVERKIAWNDVVGLDNDEWWQETTERRLATPVGKHGANKDLELWFGTDAEGRPCVHGMLGAMPGAGKSTLFHGLISGLATRYSPSELRFFLIDGKFGVEFEPYMNLPHAEVVSLKTSPDLARSVLAELVDEMKRRNAAFQRSRTADLTEYREAGQPEGAMPRLLLVVDEYQQLFEDDRDDAASRLLRQLSELGRSAGIHMLLASQRFGAAGMINQTAIFGNMHLRMAMQMTDADIKALTEFGPRGRNLIQVSCNLPGKIVINDRGGDDNGNVAGKVAFLADADHKDLIHRLVVRAEGLDRAVLPSRVVFNGEEQPDLVANPVVIRLAEDDDALDPVHLESLARLSIADGGLGMADWYAAEQPLLGLVGQEYSVRGQAKVVLRRRGTENIAVVGGNSPARFGMLVGLLAGFALTSTPERLRVRVADHSVPGAEWNGVLAAAADQLLRAAGVEVDVADDEASTVAQLKDLLAEVDRREDLAPANRTEEPTVVWLASDLDRVDAFRKVSDDYGMVESEGGREIRDLLVRGPALGVHVVASFDGMRSLLTVIDDRQGLGQFRHRIGLQMSEDDSFLLTRGRAAAQLQLSGDTPISALYIDHEQERSVRFKPYSVTAQPSSPNGDLSSQASEIGARLAKRGAANVDG